MTDKTIGYVHVIGGDYFRLQHIRKSTNNLNYYLDKFNFEDYWCFKSTNRQRKVDYNEFIEFKYSGYIFFKKDLFDSNRIIKWINWLNNIGGIQFLSRPTPPFNPSKIIIRK
jgi:hypothetical protein